MQSTIGARMYDIHQDMMRGFETLSSYFSKTPLTKAQKNKLTALMMFTNLMKHTYGPVKRFVKPLPEMKGLEQSPDHTIDIRGNRTRESHGEFYLSESEIKSFQETGVMGPFPLLSPEEAEEMRKYSHELHQRDFDDEVLFGTKEIRETLKKHNQWSINYSGMFQALRYPKLWDLVASKEITQRMASILGNDLICWRTQFFEKKPGEKGTFWHQTGTFRETSLRPKIEPSTPTSLPALQLNVWIALTDSTVSNGCMRIMPKSFADDRFERYTYHLKDQAYEYLMTLSNKDIEKALRTLEFTTGTFLRSQLAYELASKNIPNLFQGIKTQDLPMKAGEFIIFSELNMHGSYPNTTTDKTRLAIGAHYTSNDVKIYNGFKEDNIPTGEGLKFFPTDKLASMQVLGEDKFGFNVIAKYPEAKI